jgi:diguanylate cyclase (GGDEF)-like protein/PAS domain S-box-containing protein
MNTLCGDLPQARSGDSPVRSPISDNQAAELMFERVELGVGMTDMANIFTSANPALCRFFGRSEDAVLGHCPYEFMDPEDVEHISTTVSDFLAGRRDTCLFEARFVRGDGALAWGRVSLSTVVNRDDHRVYVFGQVEDITARRYAEEALQYQALHDELTGLPNRALFTDRLDQALARQDQFTSVAVMLIDLDEFKVINDAMGHEVGDRVLKEIADRIVVTARRDDTVARFGGDEFVVMSAVRGAKDAEQIARRLLEAISAPIRLSGIELSVTASIGITLSAPTSTTMELIRNADTAMYRAKQNGRERVEVFTIAMGRQASGRLDNVLALRRALDHDELSVAYQPVIRISDDSVSGVEALIRWNDPTRGWIAPDEFIPIAEDTGQIFRIGKFVLDVALRDMQRLRDTVPGAAAMTVAVNLSARQFNDPDLPEVVTHALRRAGLPVEALHLEITETAVMGDVDAALPVLAQLRELGLHVDIDDFGTGYSSLNYLKRLPVTTLKIDRTFVDGLGTDPDDSAIVSAIIALAHALGLSTIAEGVETTRQRDELRRLGCEYAQGHLWSQALDSTDLQRWINARG